MLSDNCENIIKKWEEFHRMTEECGCYPDIFRCDSSEKVDPKELLERMEKAYELINRIMSKMNIK